MKIVIATIFLVLGGMLGAHLTTYVSGPILANATFESPDEFSQYSQLIFVAGIGIFGIIGGSIGWLIGARMDG